MTITPLEAMENKEIDLLDEIIEELDAALLQYYTGERLELTSQKATCIDILSKKPKLCASVIEEYKNASWSVEYIEIDCEHPYPCLVFTSSYSEE